MANKLIQWNCRGLKANFNELLLLLTGLCPSVICFQETFLKPSDNLDIRGYTLYNHIHQKDLTLADASIFLDYSWKVHDETCGSDHFPIILENSGPGLDKIPRWNLRRAKWDEFKNSCILKLKSDANNNLDDNITYFSKTLISIAEESIPKTSSNKKYNKPWVDDDCKAAIRSRKAALCKFNLQPSAENLNNFKTSKKTSWRNYVSKLKSSSKSKKVWDMIRKISGKNSSGPIKHLSKNHIKATNKKDIADLLAKTIPHPTIIVNSSNI